MKFLSTSVLVALTLPLLGSASMTPRYVGCFSSKGNLVSNGTYPYQSPAYCVQVCSKQKKTVIGMANGNECLCGDEVPSSDEKVSRDKCDTNCAGWPVDKCGGEGTWSVYEYDLSSRGESSSSSSSLSSSSSSSSTSPSLSSTSESAAASTTSAGSSQSATGTSTTSSVAAATSSSGASRRYSLF